MDIPPNPSSCVTMPVSKVKIGPPRRLKKTREPKSFVKREFWILTEDKTREGFVAWEEVLEDPMEMVVKVKSKELDEVKVKEEEDKDLPF